LIVEKYMPDCMRAENPAMPLDFCRIAVRAFDDAVLQLEAVVLLRCNKV